jgi:inosose dehydratase
MGMKIGCAPCCWGVDDVKNPHLPDWKLVLHEAATAGYKSIELGPYGYIPLDVQWVRKELQERGLGITAGTIFDDLVAASNLPHLLKQTRAICALIKQLPRLPTEPLQHFAVPYLVVMDWGHAERDFAAGHSDRAPRLNAQQWAAMVSHIREIANLAWSEFGVRTVIHPHAGGYIEFADEIDKVMAEIPHEVAGLCLDTGHLYYAGMDPVTWLRRHAARLDYVHFKDIDAVLFKQVLGEHIAFFEACGRGVMCPIGKGVINYSQVRQTLLDLGYSGYITVEQERDPRNAGSSLNDVMASLAFLQSVGFD